LKIAIDAGHGGDNSGASGLTSKVLEKDYTLKIARQLQVTLQKAGVQQVFMTRTKDTTLDMPQRIQLLKDYGPDLLISIHLNSAGVDSVKGTSTYYRYIGFKNLSFDIYKRMLELGLKEYGNTGSFNFMLNSPTEYPNALVETLFLSNLDEEAKILDENYQQQMVEKIVAGVKDFLKDCREQ